MEVMFEVESDQLPHQLVELHEEDGARHLRALCEQGHLAPRLLLGLRHLRYIGAALMQEMTHVIHCAKAAGSEVAVVCPRGSVWATLHRVGFDSIVDVETDIASVLARWSQGPVPVPDEIASS